MRCVHETSGSCYTCDEPGAQKAHYEALVMDLPKGWTLVHSYAGRWAKKCVNPEHLLPVPACKRPAKKSAHIPGSIGKVFYNGAWIGPNLLSQQLGLSWMPFKRNLLSGMTVEQAIAQTPPIRRIKRPRLSPSSAS